MAFIESPVFPENISFGSSGGPVYNTTIVTLASGFEQRNANWVYPRHEYDVQYGIKDRDDLYAVIEFFHVVGGVYTGFRYKDWLDYTSSGEELVTFVDQNIGTGDGSNRYFQLRKQYIAGNYTRTRLIKKPVAGTVVIAVDSVQLNSGWTVDTTTGIVTFTNAPALNKPVTAGFKFHVPVRFQDDKLVVAIPDHGVASSQITLVEERL